MAKHNRYFGELETDVYGFNCDHVKFALIALDEDQAAALNAAGVHAAITGSSSKTVLVTDEITNPPYPRNLTVTPGGTTDHVAAGDVVITGTNFNGEKISEKFTFTATQSTAKEGALAFKTVESILIHEQSGAAATFAIGYKNKIGLPFKLVEKPLVFAFFDGAIQTTAPTTTVDADALEKNTITLNSALNAKEVRIFLTV
jgi:hypothetical protein